MMISAEEAADARSRLVTGFTGLGIALVWLAILTVVCYQLAIRA
ncbi:MAG TPA: hypothetical protein VFH27_17920 [Longimicrobiaceae bacterium]|nr:hypothetical protein [Longimicrobiaceae bacterium]